MGKLMVVDGGGGSEIRTHDPREGIAVFKTAAIDHSAIPPFDSPLDCTRGSLMVNHFPQTSRMTLSDAELAEAESKGHCDTLPSATERWLSGRKHHTANVVNGSNRFEGSNPSLSAMNQTSSLWEKNRLFLQLCNV